MLCFRCEHRALFLETGARPRCECGDIKTSKGGCYMFKPCAPQVLTRVDGYKDRPVGLPAAIAPRMYCEGPAENMELVFKRLPNDRYVFLWKEKDTDGTGK